MILNLYSSMFRKAGLRIGELFANGSFTWNCVLEEFVLLVEENWNIYLIFVIIRSNTASTNPSFSYFSQDYVAACVSVEVKVLSIIVAVLYIQKGRIGFAVTNPFRD